MLLQCNNKGCRATTDVKLDPKTDEVICMECGQPIKNITKFVKNNLRANKEFLKKSTKSNYNVQCSKCKKMTSPQKKDQDYVCIHCGEKLNITRFFENVIRNSTK